MNSKSKMFKVPKSRKAPFYHRNTLPKAANPHRSQPSKSFWRMPHSKRSCSPRHLNFNCLNRQLNRFFLKKAKSAKNFLRVSKQQPHKSLRATSTLDLFTYSACFWYLQVLTSLDQRRKIFLWWLPWSSRTLQLKQGALIQTPLSSKKI